MSTLLSRTASPQGYASEEYAQSLAMFGQVIKLPRSSGYLFKRDIPGSGSSDVMGGYPFFSCASWTELSTDLEALPRSLVSLVLIPEIFCPLGEGELGSMFDLVRPLRQHYLVDLEAAKHRRLSRNHERKLRKAARQGLQLDLVAGHEGLLDIWLELYQTLIERKDIAGIRAFSRESFRRQLASPGNFMFLARHHGRVVGADWYMQSGDKVYAHLSAYSEQGYALSVSYPLMQAALEAFSTTASVLDLGGVPKFCAGSSDGQAYFKAGWSTHTATALLCGRVIDQERFLILNEGADPLATNYFPWYRRGEYL